MKRSLDKMAKINRLNFKWDKNAQFYMLGQCNTKAESDTIYRVEEFLKNIEPAFSKQQKKRIANMQFIL